MTFRICCRTENQSWATTVEEEIVGKNYLCRLSSNRTNTGHLTGNLTRENSIDERHSTTLECVPQHFKVTVKVQIYVYIFYKNNFIGDPRSFEHIYTSLPRNSNSMVISSKKHLLSAYCQNFSGHLRYIKGEWYILLSLRNLHFSRWAETIND